MFDESGFDDKPSLPQQAPPKPVPPTPPKQGPAQPPANSLGVPNSLLRQSFWLQISNFIVSFVTIIRICGTTPNTTMGSIVWFGNFILIFMIVSGLMRLQRWALILFLAYCVWTVISSVVVGAYRISIMGDVVESVVDRDQLIFTQVISMMMGFALYSLLGTWYALNWRVFIPTPPSRYGLVPYVIAVGLFFLLTATQIASSRADIDLMLDGLRQSRSLTQEWFGQ